MKLVSSLVLALALSTGISACSSDDGDDGDGGGSNTLSASVGGTSFSSSGIYLAGAHSGNVVTIVGANLQGGSISLVITDITAAGTFQVGPGSTNVAQVSTLSGTTVSAWTSSLAGGSGTITVTELTATAIKGTFSFTGAASGGTAATGTKSVTNGKFNVTFDS